ncbi:MAG: ribose-phosphate pyrophosphokinase [Bacteroidales bacterium]|nr:ribose-phosphate pyrophosphokinase [Bacteroidales bacterium]
MSSRVKIFSGEKTKYLAKKISAEYGSELGKIYLSKFSDGEFQPSFEETIRGDEIFLIQSTFAPSDNLMELLLIVDAAKRASAKKIIAIIPYFGFARQDRKDKPRVSIGAKLIADLLSTAGVDRIVTIDLHADQIQGFFNIPVDHLFGSTIFVPYLKSLNIPDLVIASPDTGGTKRAAAYTKFLNSDLVICFKQRSKPNVVGEMTIIGDVKDKNVVLVDDIIDTAGTITKAADIMMRRGAKSIRAVCTHPILSGNAYENINNSAISELIVSDTIPLKEKSEKIKVISSAGLFADVIKRIHENQSISGHFEFPTFG